MIISADGRAYRKAVIDQVLIQRGAKHYVTPLRVTVEAFKPDRRRRDIDNIFKAVGDGLTHAGVWEDDSQIVDLRLYWADTLGGKLRITIEEL